MRLYPRVVLIVAALPVLVGCGASATSPTAIATTPEAGGGEVTVFAASSLKDAFGEIGGVVRTRGIEKVTFSFAGSQALAAQLSQGARADVFASADTANMAAAAEGGAIVSGTEKVLLTNKLVAITAPGVGTKVSSLEDLGKPGLKVVLAAPSVPVGRYSLQVLDKLSADPKYGADFGKRVEANVVSREDNVRQVVAKVQIGEADAGIVYVTDVSRDNVGKIDIPDAYNVIARYYIAPVKDSPNSQGGQQFIDFVLSDEGRAILAKYGFGIEE
jgi:molybdate transport system substrate-binding protein